MRSGYSQIADRRRTIPTAVAIGMLDRQAEVLKVETESSTEFVLSSDLPELESTHTIQSEQVLIPAGQMGVFSGRTARELGFVKYLAADPAALAKALGLPPTAVEDDPSLGGEWRAVRVPIQGPINTASGPTNRPAHREPAARRRGEFSSACGSKAPAARWPTA